MVDSNLPWSTLYPNLRDVSRTFFRWERVHRMLTARFSYRIGPMTRLQNAPKSIPPTHCDQNSSALDPVRFLDHQQSNRPSSSCCLYKTTTPETADVRNSYNGVATTQLVYPGRLTPEQRETAARQLAAIPGELRQAVLDELEGRLRAERQGAKLVYDPLSYLRHLCGKAAAGDFEANLGLKIRDERRQRQEEAERRRQAQLAQQAAERQKQEPRVRRDASAHIAAINDLPVPVRQKRSQISPARGRIAEVGLTLALPDYRNRVTQYVEDLHQTRTLDYLVTEARSVELEHVEVETWFADVAVDVKGKVGDFDFVVYLVHPGRAVPTELESLDGAKAGVIAIDLQGMAGALARVKEAGGTYSQALGEFLAKNIASKRWVYHPRNAMVRQQAQAELAQSIAREVDEMRHRLSVGKAMTTESGRPMAATKHQAKRQVQCECLFCGTKWDGHDPGLNNCPKCRTHLGTLIVSQKSQV